MSPEQRIHVAFGEIITDVFNPNLIAAVHYDGESTAKIFFGSGTSANWHFPTKEAALSFVKAFAGKTGKADEQP
jgi:hypothetical protein